MKSYNLGFALHGVAWKPTDQVSIIAIIPRLFPTARKARLWVQPQRRERSPGWVGMAAGKAAGKVAR
jgi:hypothetical protein